METRKGVQVGIAVAVAVLVLAGVLMYAVDYGVEATVVDKGRDGGGNFIVAETKLGGYQTKEYLPLTQWTQVQVGYFVVYHIQSGDIEVYVREGGQRIYPPLG